MIKAQRYTAKMPNLNFQLYAAFVLGWVFL
jgi:hypothetical protein